jgi:hypothetical protein
MMALRSNYSNLDMIRMAKFAKENPDLKPIPLIQAYNEKYPEVSDEQKMKNIVNWLHENDLMDFCCPKCNSSNITRRQINGIFVCNMCGNEWMTEL